MESTLINLLQFLEETSENTALITVIQVKGSSPRKTGAKMLVLADGRTYGTIGGGCGEAEVKREALSVLDMKRSKKYRLDLTNDIAAREGMVCGGLMDFFIDFIGCRDNDSKHVLSIYNKSVQKKENPLMVTITGTDDSMKNLLGRKLAFLPANKEVGDLGMDEITEQARILAENIRQEKEIRLISIPDGRMRSVKQLELLFEPGFLSPELLVLGGGHISQTLVKMASFLGYKTIVVDDRPEFANIVRFPEAESVICDSFENYLKETDSGPNTYVIIITRGHKNDMECLREVITKPAAYIGMIGSRRKVGAIIAKLKEEGFSERRLKEIYAPIGLNIGAETPEEIALSILSEVVSVWRTGDSKNPSMSALNRAGGGIDA